ncbi:UDP-N-acetylglucosamine 2-epimerase (non-hydrolyzing) [Fusibacter tunisiensis]|uniref:UDP-N-acetylglucosamine 2-epimerase (non-hydrolyzing) n=2 Tax=Fusibacter tunisiensis TaxID=1008308 RepID=A0ABS2MPG1_9FIRM|nr:UDP-N-acetylglucosamine 2-epimerase (non-hydrolyzing) [Fusibacter tunisiensis]
MKILVLFGTRPEAIKMAPLVKALEREEDMEVVVCVTAQHREMLDQVLEVFQIKPQYDLNLMQHGQTLSQITSRALVGIESILKNEKPDLVLVHGDTTTTLSGALAAFYQQIPVGHVEAGLRSGNPYSPYPEEMNRMLASKLATVHFAATEGNVDNLIKEGINPQTIYKTGNTVIDALMSVVTPEYVFKHSILDKIDYNAKKVIVLTAHRRENQGTPMVNIFTAVREVVDANPDVEVVFPVHLNPKVRDLAQTLLSDHSRIHLIEPLEYEPFANLIGKSYLILTDSGGIQEEAPALGKPVVVLRTETERPEAVEAGTVVIAGVEKDAIVTETNRLLQDASHYKQMSGAVNPYGDGTACEKIIRSIYKLRV